MLSIRAYPVALELTQSNALLESLTHGFLVRLLMHEHHHGRWEADVEDYEVCPFPARLRQRISPRRQQRSLSPSILSVRAFGNG
jgi:hypothetical protein